MASLNELLHVISPQPEAIGEQRIIMYTSWKNCSKLSRTWTALIALIISLLWLVY